MHGPFVDPEVIDVAPGGIRVDGKGGLAGPAFEAARPMLAQKVHSTQVLVENDCLGRTYLSH